LGRLWTRRSCLAAALALAMPAAGMSSTANRIVAVGDLHGDFSAWRDIVRAAQLMDEKGHWIGGEAVLIQTGDAVDRGAGSLRIIQDLMRLQGEAPQARGQVIALVGNHEAMNMTGDLRYVSAEDYAAYADRTSESRRERVYGVNRAVIAATYRKRDPRMTDGAIRQAWFKATPLGSIEHRIAWAPRGAIGQWIARNPAVILLDGTVFVHGGISPAYVHTSIEEINREVSSALVMRSNDPRSIINDPAGPLWYRGLATPNAKEAAGNPEVAPKGADSASPPAPPVEEQLDSLLSTWGAKRIVIGHTPNLSGIANLYGGRLLRIDTGISSVYGGKVSYLEIVDGSPISHVVERSQPAMK